MISNSVNLEINNHPKSESFFDLSKYDQSWYNRGRPSWFVLLWWFIQAVTFPLTLHQMSGLRCAILRLFGAKIGKNVLIRPTARFTYPWKISIGDYSWIGDNVTFYSLDQIDIASNCIISQKSYLCTGSHDINDSAFGLTTAPIKIHPGVWIAADCFVGPGVEIGANSVIGARSSVFCSIPPSQVCWGTPCRPRYARKL